MPYLEPDAETWRKHRETLDAHLPFRDFELVRPAPDGGKRYVSVSGLPVFDEAGRFVGYRGVGRHITERKRAEEALREVQMELARVARLTTLGELTAAIAHEVNQPLTGVVSSANACLRWLAGERPDLDAARRSVERIINDGRRAGEVISRIRALAKKSPPQKDWLNINDAIVEVIALIRTEVERNRILLHTDLANGLPPVLGDRVQLQQVILNLVMNAIEAMSGAAVLRRELVIASVTDELGGVNVAVRDSGTGLGGTAIDRLFEAFYTTKSDGMGMGLAISRTIIEAHGGRLWARPNLSRGAAFEFRLPTDGEEESSSKRLQ